MMIKTMDQYKQINAKVSEAIREVNYHIKMARIWKKLYQATENRRGFGWLNQIARRQNNKHFSIGTKLSVENLETCLSVMDELNEFLKDEGSM